MKPDLKKLRAIAEKSQDNWGRWNDLYCEWLGPETAIALLDELELLREVESAATEYVMGRTIFKEGMGKALTKYWDFMNNVNERERDV